MWIFSVFLVFYVSKFDCIWDLGYLSGHNKTVEDITMGSGNLSGAFDDIL